MRNAGRLKLGYYPLPLSEAQRLRSHLVFPDKPFSALDPCVGDGSAFETLVRNTTGLRYGLELDTYRAGMARNREIEVIQGDTLDVQCRIDSLAFLYLNPPYDFEVGKTDNLRMELVFLRHTGRWVMPGGVLLLVIPQTQLGRCARTLAEHFEQIRIYRLIHPDCVKYNQISVLAVRRARKHRLRDQELESQSLQLEAVCGQELAPLSDVPEHLYPIPACDPAVFVHKGLPLDEIEDKLAESSAYRQVRRILLREPGTVCGRPLTPLHGGHVGLLCTAGMLNGVFGQGELRHVAHWQSRKYTQTWQEEEEGSNVRHIREYFSHECTILWTNGTTQVLTHEAAGEEDDPDGENPEPVPEETKANGLERANASTRSKVVMMAPHRKNQ